MVCHRVAAALMAAVVVTGGALAAAQEGEERPYLLETIGEVAVVQLYADGFEALLSNQEGFLKGIVVPRS